MAAMAVYRLIALALILQNSFADAEAQCSKESADAGAQCSKAAEQIDSSGLLQSRTAVDIEEQAVDTDADEAEDNDVEDNDADDAEEDDNDAEDSDADDSSWGRRKRHHRRRRAKSGCSSATCGLCHKCLKTEINRLYYKLTCRQKSHCRPGYAGWCRGNLENRIFFCALKTKPRTPHSELRTCLKGIMCKSPEVNKCEGGRRRRGCPRALIEEEGTTGTTIAEEEDEEEEATLSQEEEEAILAQQAALMKEEDTTIANRSLDDSESLDDSLSGKRSC